MKYLLSSIVCFIIFMTGCSTKLHPLLVEHHGNRELSDKEVDIRLIQMNPISLQANCLMDDPLSILKFPVLACAKLDCGEKKRWETKKICTCSIKYVSDIQLEHETKHCRGWIGW